MSPGQLFRGHLPQTGRYHLAPTIFSRRELKVLIIFNGRRSLSHQFRILPGLQVLPLRA